MQISEILALTDLNDQVLRSRASSARQPRSRQFLCLSRGDELGYLSFDHVPEIATGVVYEILVLQRFRRRGIGSRLLSHAEDLALQLQCSRVRLTARAFDGTIGQGSLESWYSNRGYAFATDGTQEFEKQLHRDRAHGTKEQEA